MSERKTLILPALSLAFTCECESRNFIVDLEDAWECWWVHEETGELMGVDDAGNNGWKNPRCAECDASLLHWEGESDEREE